LTLTQTVLTRWRAYGAIFYFLLKLQGFGINFQKNLQFFFILTLLNIENQLIKSFQQTLFKSDSVALCVKNEFQAKRKRILRKALLVKRK
jgi:hypothetical protein